MTPPLSFKCEVEQSKDELGINSTRITCHGRLVAGNTRGITDVVKPLIPLGGHIRLDLFDLSYVDSSGLGALVELKTSAIRQGRCFLELVNIPPRVLDLLRIANVLPLFAR